MTLTCSSQGSALVTLCSPRPESTPRASSPLSRGGDVHAIAHVTGGGIVENLPRVLPQGTRAVIDASTWRRPAVFEWIQHTGGIADDEMWRTFNCGVGMLLVVAHRASGTLVSALESNGERAWMAGRIEQGEGAPEARIE